MVGSSGALLLAITYLVVKHAIADFFLQTPYQYLNKGKYGHPGGILHSSIHAAMTLPVFYLLPPLTAWVMVIIPIGEFGVHYHVDWLKEQSMRRNAWTVTNPWFWRALGVDQMAHMLTYVGIVALLTAR